MASAESQTVTRLLQGWSEGDGRALDKLMPIVYEDLRKIAARLLSGEKAGHTLPATALVHEAFFRLANAEIAWQNRAHFYAIAARVLRRVLVEHAKAKNRQKRGSGAEMVPIDEALMIGPKAAEIVADLDEALNRLALQDERKSDIIQLMFFGGLTYEEIAQALSISPATVHRELKLAKAWLHRELTQSAT